VIDLALVLVVFGLTVDVFDFDEHIYSHGFISLSWFELVLIDFVSVLRFVKFYLLHPRQAPKVADW
jgi:hypothetical protein